MMDPILPEFEALVANVRLASPAIPFVATLRGEWADGAVLEPSYWSAQLRATVRFADGLRTLTARWTRRSRARAARGGAGAHADDVCRRDSPRGGTGAAPPDVAACPGRAAHGHRSRAGRARSPLGERGGGRLAGVPQHGTATPGRPADVPVRAPELLDRAESGRCRRPEDPRHGGVVLPAGVARGPAARR